MALFGPPFVSALTLLIVFGALYLTYRERFLAIWMAAWAVWTLRYIYGMAGGGTDTTTLHLLVIARAVLMLWGAYELDRRRLPGGWILIAAAETAWVIIGAVVGIDTQWFGARGVEHYLFFAVALAVSGFVVLRSTTITGPEKAVAGGALLLFGVQQAIYPWSPMFPSEIAQILFLTAHALQTAIGLGMLMAFMRRSRMEADALASRVDELMTRALSGLLPICAHCKSIRAADGEWTRLERYVSERTGSQFTHGICPTCERTHFGEHASR